LASLNIPKGVGKFRGEEGKRGREKRGKMKGEGSGKGKKEDAGK